MMTTPGGSSGAGGRSGSIGTVSECSGRVVGVFGGIGTVQECSGSVWGADCCSGTVNECSGSVLGASGRGIGSVARVSGSVFGVACDGPSHGSVLGGASACGCGSLATGAAGGKAEGSAGDIGSGFDSPRWDWVLSLGS